MGLSQTLKARAALAVQDAKLFGLTDDLAIAEDVLRRANDPAEDDLRILGYAEARIEKVRTNHTPPANELADSARYTEITGGHDLRALELSVGRFGDAKGIQRLQARIYARANADLVVTVNPNYAGEVASYLADAHNGRRAGFIGTHPERNLGNLLQQIRAVNASLKGELPLTSYQAGKAPLRVENGTVIRDVLIDLTPEAVPDGALREKAIQAVGKLQARYQAAGINLKFIS